MKDNPWIAALLNFLLMGLGYVYLGKRTRMGTGMTLGALALTYVELNLKGLDTKLYVIMFAAIVLLNTLFAIDVYHEAKAHFEEDHKKSKIKRRLRATP